MMASELSGNTRGTEPAKGRPTLLIVSYSDIAKDARLRKQIDLFTKSYDVTVYGFGEPFDTDAQLLLHDSADTRRTERIRAALLHAKQYRLAQHFEANNIAAREVLKGREFDVVLTNDIEPVGLAIELFGADKVHADLHEYYPGLHDQNPAWVKLRHPYYRWMLLNQASKAASVTTVSQGIADRYEKEFGFTAAVVENALPYMATKPGPVGDTIKLVHSGAALPNRSIETMMRAAAASSNSITLDLYLTGTGTPYYDSLWALAAELGPRITLHQPVVREDLIPTLSQYDLGIHILPATATNNMLALPNKFFDFVQAGLGLIVGPTEEMSRRINTFNIGAVTKDFQLESLVETLDGLSTSQVEDWKRNSEVAARKLDVTSMLCVWKDAVDTIASDARTEIEVDAVIPVHRADRPVARAVASLFEGNKTKTRAIVIAHNIDVAVIEKALGSWADDPRVLVSNLEDHIPSPSGPMNHGFDLATAPFTTLLGSDDTLEPGAIDRWVTIANDAKNPADFVIANRSETSGITAAVPPVRAGRRVWLDGAKDRLSYRAAPLGLLRRATFGKLRFPQGVFSGEDIEFSNHLWFSGANIAFAFGSPGYLVHEDQSVRVTTTLRSINDEFIWAGSVLDMSKPWMRSKHDRQAFIVKMLRKNVIDAVRNRVSDEWDLTAARQMQELLIQVFDMEPDAFGFLSKSEAELIAALLRGEQDSSHLESLLGAALNVRSVGSLLPVMMRNLFSAQAPLAYHLAGRTLVRQLRRK